MDVLLYEYVKGHSIGTCVFHSAPCLFLFYCTPLHSTPLMRYTESD